MGEIFQLLECSLELVCEKAGIVGITCCGGGILRHTADFHQCGQRCCFMVGTVSFTVFTSFYQRKQNFILHLYRINNVLQYAKNLQNMFAFSH